MPRAKKIVARRRVASKPVMDMEPNPMPMISAKFSKKYKVMLAVLVFLGILGLYWKKTNGWPVVAVVNGMPIWRFQMHQVMEAKYGTAVVDDMVTRKLITSELAKRKIVVNNSEIELRLDNIKKRFGDENQFNIAVNRDGLTLEKLKEQLRMQVGLEKLAEPTTESAKLQKEVVDIVNKWKEQASIWTVFGK